jgi:hypothetical protein
VEMHSVDDVPLVVGHVCKGLVAENTGVVDEDVDAAVFFDRGLYDCLAVLHVGLVAHSLTTQLLNLLNGVIGVDEVVDNDLCSALGQLQTVDTAKTSSSSSDKHNLALEVELLALGVGGQLLGLLQELQRVCRASWVFWLGEVDDVLPLGCKSARCQGIVGPEQSTTSPLPPQLGNVPSSSLEYRARLGRRLVRKDSHERDDPLGLQLLEDIGGHDGLGHSAGGDWGDDVAEDVVLEALLGECLGEAHEGEFGGCNDKYIARIQPSACSPE